MRRMNWLGLTTIAALLLSGATLEAQDNNGNRPDLLPRDVRWQTFPPDVRRVTVDANGRPWFEVEGTATRDALKRQVEAACKLPAPWVKGARISLLDRKGRVWLRANDDWTLLLGYDPKSGEWSERRVVPEKERNGHDEKRPDSGRVVFMDTAYESKTGRLYFADRLGIHVLDAGQWSYQPLYRLNLERNWYYDKIRSFDEPNFAEEAGRVIVWTRWGRYGWTGTVGFFIHDGKTWTHKLLEQLPAKIDPAAVGPPAPRRDTPENPDHNRLGAVVPLTEDRLLICTESGPAYIIARKGDGMSDEEVRQVVKDIALLGDEVFAVRQAANERLARLGPAVLPWLREGLKKHDDIEIVTRLKQLIEAAEHAQVHPQVDGHQFVYTRVHGVDTQGNAWLWFDRCRTPDGKEERTGFRLISREGKVLEAPVATKGWYPDSLFSDRKGRVYFARYRQGCVMFDGKNVTPITDATQADLRYVLGEDAAGRIYLTNERRVYAFLASAADERGALPTTLYDVLRGGCGVVQDSRGRMWALVFLPEQRERGTMAVFEKGAWKEADLPGDRPAGRFLNFFMPLKEGCLVCQDCYHRVFFYDGDAWHEHKDLKELVEKRHKDLARRIDNRQWGGDFNTKLRVDAAGRIWLVEWTQVAAVYDGERWIDLMGPLNAAVPGGRFLNFNWLIPLPGAKEMLATSGFTRTSHVVSIDEGKVKVAPARLPGGGQIVSDYTTRSGLWIDGRDRIWIPRNASTCVLIDGERTREMTDTGFPRFEDSRGCVWFHNPAQRKLVVLDAKGRRAVLTDEALGMESGSVVEDRSGAMWVCTDRGLLNVRVKMEEAGPVVERGKLYEKDAPRGYCVLTRVDREGSLWFYGPGHQINYRLYRVQLPTEAEKE